MRLRSFLAALVFGAGFAGCVAAALAWGGTGHTFISDAGAAAFPTSLPSFVRVPSAVAEIAALGPELDRSKDAGKSHDADRDPGHYLDLADDGTVGGLPLDALPATREGYDTALRAAKTDQYRMGFLPYALVDGWEQVAKDFAIWRVDRVGEERATTDAARSYYAADRSLREGLTVRDIGVWSHYVGDASQPLHVTVHFNGWGNYPNPNGFTESKTLHADFEGAFVRDHATLAAVEAAMSPPALSSQPIAAQVAAYLRRTNSYVPQLYTIEKSGGFAAASPQAVSFVDHRLADGADELRDLVTEAYAASDTMVVGYPNGITPRDAENGSALPTPARSGTSD